MTESDDQAARHDPVYEKLGGSADFAELRSRYRKFIFPATLAFMVWYFLYVLLAMFAPGLMNIKVLGHINVALLIGLLQFVTTFLIAYLYSSYSNRNLDPLAGKLNEQYQAARHSGEDH